MAPKVRVRLGGVDDSTPAGQRKLARFQELIRGATYSDMLARFGEPETDEDGAAVWKINVDDVLPREPEPMTLDSFVERALLSDEQATYRRIRQLEVLYHQIYGE